jgi:hypothetical protein
MHFLTSCVALAVGFSAQGASSLRGEKHVSEKSVGKAFVKALEFKRRLRVCNAYPYPTAMELFKGAEKISDEPLAYKDCKDFGLDLTPGDKLLFKVGSANAGTFSVSDLPNNDAVLLLIVYRHDTLSTAVSFESHVYANLLNAQVAVVDTYKGTDKALLKINDHEDAKTSRSEELRFDSVVAVNPGKYDAVLVSPEGETLATMPFVALNRESYVILRTGVKAQQGTSYEQSLVVFPQSDAGLLGGAAASSLAALIAVFVLQLQ